MSSPARFVKRRIMTVAVSAGLHGVLLACLMVSFLPFGSRVVVDVRPEKIAGVEIAGGSHAVPIRLPAMDTAARTRHPVPRTEAEPKNILQPKQAVKRPGGGSPAAPHAGDGAGQAMAGDGSDDRNAKPTFPIFFPKPLVTDRAMLPDKAQKVVVDVTIDATGAVVSENLISGVSRVLDQLVLETVKTWRFQPATVDGKPVAAQAELVFPFDQSYPIASS